MYIKYRLAKKNQTVKIRSKAGNVFLRKGSVDMKVLHWIIDKKELEPIKDFISEDCRNKKGIVIDAGANIGISTRVLSTIFPNSKIIGLEPDYENYQLALANTTHLNNVEIRQVAISNKCGRTVLRKRGGEHNFLGSTILDHLNDQTGEIQEIETCDLSTILDEFDTESILFMKCDIEGAESHILNKEFSKLISHILIELHPHFDSSISEKWKEFNSARTSHSLEGEKHFSSKFPR